MIRLPLLACLLAPVLIDLPTGCLIAQGLISQTSVERNPQDPNTVTVIGRGIGLDLESAQKDALKNAVEKAVGLLLDAETILENDDIIETILTYSGAYIEKYETLETKKEDSGLFRVKIRAEVKKTQLEEKLVEEKLIKKKIDGKSVFAKARSKLNEKSSSALLFRRAFEGFPLGVLRATFEAEEDMVTESEYSVGLGMKVRIEIDPDAWSGWVKQLEKTLGPMARAKGTFRPRTHNVSRDKKFFAESGCPELMPRELWSLRLPNSPRGEDFEKLGVPYDKGTFFLFVAPKGGAGQDLTWYQLARDPLLLEMGRVLARYPILQASVVDAEGSILASSEFACAVPYGLRAPESGYRLGAYAGYPLVDNANNGPQFTLFDISTDIFAGAWCRSSSFETWNSDLYDGSSKAMDLNYVFSLSCIPGFTTYRGDAFVDSFVIPLLLDVPLDKLEDAAGFEVKLIQKTLPAVKITVYTVAGEKTTEKTVEFLVEEDPK